jgi:hypothetical protein
MKGKRENRYVFKVMNEHREGGRSFGPQGSKVVRSLLIGLELIYSIFIVTYKCNAGLK